ncbi:protein FAM90A1 [Pteropus vampyrus]|uniref:Protein FAM90A1 n=1 Tax=Pteropus vampyrus TaxID=132908 RepID=A0A6P3RTU3_PTEVA|nr:protein FAM90A1 [Pteropus vampyrus]
MAGGDPQRWPRRLQKGKKPQRAVMAHRAPPAEEEDPRVKCKDCGAFGHKARCLSCPMKRWAGALAPQPRGFHKMKENLKPWTPRELRKAGHFHDDDTEEPRPRPDARQRQALLQRYPMRPQARPRPNWKDRTEFCDYVRHPQRPRPVHTTKRNCVLDSALSSGRPVGNPDVTCTAPPPQEPEWSTFSPPGLNNKVSIKAPGQTAAQISIQTCQSPRKKPRLGPCQTPRKSWPGPDLGLFQTLQPPASATAAGLSLAPQATGRNLGQVQSIDFQPPHKGPVLKAVQACLAPQLVPIDQVPGQLLRMVFTRLDSGRWSSRFVTAPSFAPAQEPSPSGQSPPISARSEGPCARAPLSVLYDDLQLSSSSEDSDGQ